jgi:dihydrodiol dehydrogenase / D-xylose 1-dehydrogenase (NADP)
MKREIGWGILGPGRIATLVTRGALVHLDGVRRVAVGSREGGRAAEFAARFGFARSYGSYEELARDPDVEVVYVATPHAFHCEHTLLCLEQGKHVLCEKPMAINARQVREMAACARANGRLLVEAMFTRWVPAHHQVRQWIAEGRIGEVRLMWASSGFRAGPNPEDRLHVNALGGGALLDIGVYPVAFAHQVMGVPEEIAAAGHIGPAGVDEHDGFVLRYAGGRLAMLSCAISQSPPNDAAIRGTEGMIRLDATWWAGPRTASLHVDRQEPVHFRETPADWLYEAAEFRDYEKSWMVADVMDCVREGRLESPLMPLDESIAIAETMDRVRAQVGLVYPADKA